MRRTLLLIIIAAGIHLVFNFTLPDFDCQEIHDLCPGEVVQVSCTLVDQQPVIQQWEVDLEKCNKLEVDFNNKNNEGDKECATCECGTCENITFCGELQSKSPKFVSTLNFTMRESFDGKTIDCFKLLEHESFTTSCAIKLAALPLSPSNITTTNCHHSLISWDPPEGTSVPILYYQVNITSSDGKNWKRTVKDTYARIPDIAINSNATYVACISAINCIGAGQPACTELTEMVPKEPPVTGLSATVINDTAVHLTWHHKKLNTSTKICYDLESNFNIIKRCVPNSDIVLTLRQGFVYQVRVRARRHGTSGKWSDPICIVFSAPAQLILTNYSLNKEEKNTTLTIFLRLYENPVINKHCVTVPVTKISIEYDISPSMEYHPFSDSGLDQRFDIEIPLGNDGSNRTTITLTLRGHNRIGPGLPVLVHVPIDSDVVCGLTIIHTASIISLFLPILVILFTL